MKKFSFAKEISGIIFLKLVVIFALWWICFSKPIKDHLTTKDLAQHFISSSNKELQ